MTYKKKMSRLNWRRKKDVDVGRSAVGWRNEIFFSKTSDPTKKFIQSFEIALYKKVSFAAIATCQASSSASSSADQRHEYDIKPALKSRLFFLSFVKNIPSLYTHININNFCINNAFLQVLFL